MIPIPESSTTSAIEVAKTLGVSYREGFVKNRYIGRTFIMPKQEMRSKSVRRKLNPVSYEFKDKNILLIDDSIVRGTTSKKIIENSKTIFKVLDKNSNCSLLEMNPITGRKHQLRKQLSLIGHPIYGDDKYTFEKNLKTKNKELMLHSYKIKFIINNKKYTFKALLPIYFKKLLI